MNTIPDFVLLSKKQNDQLNAFAVELAAMNEKLNLISRESAKHIFERHILHSLAICLRGFPDGSTIVDWGTGGGLPGIPLAICFPGSSFVLIDSTGKKVRAVQSMVRELGLTNVEAVQTRAENWDGKADFAVSRATASMLDLWKWSKKVFRKPGTDSVPDTWPQGLICLKGGDLAEEQRRMTRLHPHLQVEKHDLYPLLGSSYFEQKQLLLVRKAS